MGLTEGKQTLLGAALAAVLALAACAAPTPTATPTSPPAVAPTPTKAPTATPTKRPIVKASVAFAGVALTYIPAWTARGKGFFQEEGLDVDWVITGSGAKVTTAVIGRSVEIGMAATPDIITAVSQGQPIQAFAVVSTGQSAEITMRTEVAQQRGVTRQSSLEDRVKALKGLKVGATSPGSGMDYAVRYLLAKYNIDPERDLEIMYVGSTGLLPALRQGAIDVMAYTQPDASVAEIEGFGKILISFPRGDIPETKDHLWNVPIGHKSTIDSQPELLEAFVRAIWRGARLVKENREEAQEVIFKTLFSDMDPAVFRSAFDTSYAASPATPEATEKGFQSSLEYRNKTEKGSPLTVNFADFYTPKIVEAARKQLGF